MRDAYYVDSPNPVEAYSRVGAEPDFYIAVIRHRARPGWVFRFSEFDVRLVRETLAALNQPRLVAHHFGGVAA